MEITVKRNENFVIKSLFIGDKCNGMAQLILNETSFGCRDFDYDLLEFYHQLMDGFEYGEFEVDCIFDITPTRFRELFEATYGVEPSSSTTMDSQLTQFFQKKDSIVFTHGDYGLDKYLVGFLQKEDFERLILIDTKSGLTGDVTLPKGEFKSMVSEMCELLQKQ
jgi:hypothetical protein